MTTNMTYKYIRSRTLDRIDGIDDRFGNCTLPAHIEFQKFNLFEHSVKQDISDLLHNKHNRNLPEIPMKTRSRSRNEFH